MGERWWQDLASERAKNEGKYENLDTQMLRVAGKDKPLTAADERRRHEIANQTLPYPDYTTEVIEPLYPWMTVKPEKRKKRDDPDYEPFSERLWMALGQILQHIHNGWVRSRGTRWQIGRFIGWSIVYIAKWLLGVPATIKMKVEWRRQMKATNRKLQDLEDRRDPVKRKERIDRETERRLLESARRAARAKKFRGLEGSTYFFILFPMAFVQVMIILLSLTKGEPPLTPPTAQEIFAMVPQEDWGRALWYEALAWLLLVVISLALRARRRRLYFLRLIGEKPIDMRRLVWIGFFTGILITLVPLGSFF